jgi:Ankyrin repeats (many copies)
VYHLVQNEYPLLMHAAYNGHLPVAEALLDEGAGELSQALVCAATGETGGHTAVAALLIDRGADIHLWNDQALYNSVSRGRLEMSEFLLHAEGCYRKRDIRGCGRAAWAPRSRRPAARTRSSLS